MVLWRNGHILRPWLRSASIAAVVVGKCLRQRSNCWKLEFYDLVMRGADDGQVAAVCRVDDLPSAQCGSAARCVSGSMRVVIGRCLRPRLGGCDASTFRELSRSALHHLVLRAQLCLLQPWLPGEAEICRATIGSPEAARRPRTHSGSNLPRLESLLMAGPVSIGVKMCTISRVRTCSHAARFFKHEHAR